jgi:hypothetical protein
MWYKNSGGYYLLNSLTSHLPLDCSLSILSGIFSSSTPKPVGNLPKLVQKQSLQPKPLFFKRMMNGGGCNKRDRRFLTIESLGFKNEYCSDNIIEMTAVVELLWPCMDGQYETIRGLGLSG